MHNPAAPMPTTILAPVAVAAALVENTPADQAAAPRLTMTPALRQAIITAARVLQTACFEASKAGGWHNHQATGAPLTRAEEDARFPTRIALCHSELSEALEGHRCGDRRDDKLPHRRQAEVELADTLARIFDTGEAQLYDLGPALADKIEYNLARIDHTPAARLAAGGKRY